MGPRFRFHSIVLLLVAALSVAAPAMAANRLTVVMSGIAKGTLETEQVDPDTRRTTYHFRDRGRGPDLVTTVKADTNGLPLSLDISGTDYRRMPVTERFSVEGGTATWMSGADSGNAPAGGYYLPHRANDEDMAALARALLKTPERRLPLLPAGSATIEKADELRVRGKPGKVLAVLYFIRGLGLQPSAIWLDQKGELFAAGGPWIGVVRTGYEEALPTLIETQDRALAEAARAAAGRLSRRPDGPLLIRSANLFDAERRRMLPGMSVLVKGDRIAAVGPDGTIAAPADAEVIEAEGRALLPGLWDMHVHLFGQEDGLLTMMAGITTVRDMGNDPEPLKELVDQFDAGTLVGPHVLKAALIDGRGPFAGPTKSLVATPEEVRAAVNHYADLGYPMIKLYASLDPTLVPVAVEAAHARGLRVGGHVPAGMTIEQAVEAGYDEVQHANYWLLDFLGPDVLARTNTPARFTDAYERGHEIDPDGAAVGALVDDLKAHGTVIDPTLVTFETMFTGKKGELAEWMQPWAGRLPAVMLRGGRGGGRATTPQELETYRESYRRMQQILLRLHEADVPIVAGTDGNALLYPRELELHVAAGLPPLDVLYNATLGAARVMGRQDESGSISVGKRADMIVVEGDPSQRIGDIRRVRTVIKDGAIHDGAALAEAAGLSSPTSETE